MDGHFLDIFWSRQYTQTLGYQLFSTALATFKSCRTMQYLTKGFKKNTKDANIFLTCSQHQPKCPRASEHNTHRSSQGNQTFFQKVKMELDLESLFGLHVHSCTHWLRPLNPPLLGSYTRALLVSQNGRHLLWPL